MANNEYINKVVFGNDTLVDLTNDSVEASNLLEGETAHDRSGSPITGTAKQGHVIKDADGTSMTQRQNLQFKGATVTDDSANNRTVVECQSGGLLPHLLLYTETGLTVTVSKGETTISATETSVGTYEADVTSYGVWTCSDGTKIKTVDVQAVMVYEVKFAPTGSTVTPTDSIPIWLECGGRSETYTTISQVLKDTTCLSALIANQNAADYMARSTTWANTVCANQNAMTYIGLNNYCSNILLANSTWSTAICNSTYFENVLNTKVPIMTSNTAPSGVASANSVHSDCYAYKAFDSASNGWLANGNATMGSAYVQYMFPYDVNVKKFSAKFNVSNGYTATVKVQGSNDGNNFTNLSSNLTYANSFTNFNLSNFAFYKYFRILYISNNVGNKGNDGNGHKYQFYGRRNI